MEHNRWVYETRYSPDDLRLDRSANAYDREMTRLRLAYLRRLCDGREIADLGCGSGAYLFPLAPITRRIYGIDFSQRLINACAQRIAEAGTRNVSLIVADVRALPLPDNVVDCAFSISTLYTVPDTERAIGEAARIVRPGGSLLLELGNLWSLNTLVARHSPTGLRSYHMPVAAMLRLLRSHGLRIEEHRAFQILPMYGGPWYLKPLVSARWKSVMGTLIRGLLLDELISSLPLFRSFAFRHLFVCSRVT